MMTTLSIKKKNEVYVTVQSAEPHVHHELSDYFSFEVPEAKFLKKNPRYKYWDGTIRLYSPGTGELYGGLMKHLQVWADERQYQIEYEKKLLLSPNKTAPLFLKKKQIAKNNIIILIKPNFLYSPISLSNDINELIIKYK